MDINKYISRIGYEGKLSPNEECLKELHRCHLMSIPYEALDVQLGKRISLDLNKIFKKVIDNQRGGYCYELNYIFHWLLTKVGFENHLVSARIFDNEKIGPEFDHMAIVVKLNDLWLVDVGYGDLFITPLKIKTDIEQEDKFKLYKLIPDGKNDYLLLESLKSNVNWIRKYSFNLKPCLIDDFKDQHEYKQSSSDSYFVRNMICSLPNESGRKTILNNTFKIRTGSVVREKQFTSQKELTQILENDFNIRITSNILD